MISSSSSSVRRGVSFLFSFMRTVTPDKNNCRGICAPAHRAYRSGLSRLGALIGSGEHWSRKVLGLHRRADVADTHRLSALLVQLECTNHGTVASRERRPLTLGGLLLKLVCSHEQRRGSAFAINAGLKHVQIGDDFGLVPASDQQSEYDPGRIRRRHGRIAATANRIIRDADR